MCCSYAATGWADRVCRRNTIPKAYLHGRIKRISASSPADTLCYAGGGGRSSISGHKPHTADRDAQRATRRRELCGMMDKQRMLAPRERQEESIKGGGGS